MCNLLNWPCYTFVRFRLGINVFTTSSLSWLSSLSWKKASGVVVLDYLTCHHHFHHICYHCYHNQLNMVWIWHENFEYLQTSQFDFFGWACKITRSQMLIIAFHEDKKLQWNRILLNFRCQFSFSNILYLSICLRVYLVGWRFCRWIPEAEVKLSLDQDKIGFMTKGTPPGVGVGANLGNAQKKTFF